MQNVFTTMTYRNSYSYLFFTTLVFTLMLQILPGAVFATGSITNGQDKFINPPKPQSFITAPKKPAINYPYVIPGPTAVSRLHEVVIGVTAVVIGLQALFLIFIITFGRTPIKSFIKVPQSLLLKLREQLP